MLIRLGGGNRQYIDLAEVVQASYQPAIVDHPHVQDIPAFYNVAIRNKSGFIVLSEEEAEPLLQALEEIVKTQEAEK